MTASPLRRQRGPLQRAPSGLQGTGEAFGARLRDADVGGCDADTL